jgi:predicted DNA-binding protein YlxM (UPF0122 family)
MDFKKFLLLENTSDFEISNMYFNDNYSLRKIAKKTGKSMRQIYNIINFYGKPNRINTNKKETARNLLLSGINNKDVARISGYTVRHIRNLGEK